MRLDVPRFLTTLCCSASVATVALFVAATAAADPLPPAPMPGPDPAPVQAAAPAPVLALSGVNAPAPTVDTASQAATGQLPTPPNGVPHLASPDAPPPGSTMDPSAKGTDSPNVSYLKDLWQAVQSHEISGKEALLMGIAQRGMNTPYPAQAPGPNVPTSPADPALAPPPPPGPPLPWLGPPPASQIPATPTP